MKAGIKQIRKTWKRRSEINKWEKYEEIGRQGWQNNEKWMEGQEERVSL